MIKIKQKISLETGMKYLALLLISLFTLNPIIQCVYYQFRKEWYPLREYYNYVVLGVGIAVFGIYILLRWLNDKNVGIFGVQKRNPAFILFILFAILMTVSTVKNKGNLILKTGFNNVAMVGGVYRNEGLLTYLSYLMFFLFAAFITDEKIKLLWLKIFGLGSSLVAFVITLDFFFPALKIDAQFLQGNKWNGNSKLFFNNPNHIAYYMLVSAIVCAILFVKAKKRRDYFLYGIPAFIGVSALIINDTLGCILAYLGIGVFTVIVLMVSEKKFNVKQLAPFGFFALSLALLLLLSPAIREAMSPNLASVSDMGKANVSLITEGKLDEEIVSNDAGTGRVKLWKTAAQFISYRPWLGYSSDGMAHKMRYETGFDRCHNEYLNYALSFGIPAAVCYVSALFAVYLRALKHKRELSDSQKISLIAAFGYCVSAFFGNTMFYTAPLLFILLGLGYFRKYQNT